MLNAKSGSTAREECTVNCADNKGAVNHVVATHDSSLVQWRISSFRIGSRTRPSQAHDAFSGLTRDLVSL